MCFIDICNLKVRVHSGQTSMEQVGSVFLWSYAQNPWKKFQAVFYQSKLKFLLQFYFGGRLLAVSCAILKEGFREKQCFYKM